MGSRHYWFDKTERAKAAQKHTAEMDKQYAKEIIDRIGRSKIYTDIVGTIHKPKVKDSEIILVPATSEEIIKKYNDGKTAILNFASYKNPGGRFIDGSSAQEESLCHASYLYNVLRDFDLYYKANTKNLNRGLYTNRAIYTPDVRFENGIADVITCAAPNFTAADKYQNVSREENNTYLWSRIRFVIDIAIDNQVDTLILGAYGCGVFGQDPATVAEYFLKAINDTPIKTVVFAIPKGKYDDNYEAFRNTIPDVSYKLNMKIR